MVVCSGTTRTRRAGCRRPVRLTADPPRVEEARAGAVVAVEVEAQVAGALHEERAPLGVERLERREVDDAGRFDLPKSGFIVAVIVRPGVRAYLMSARAEPSGSGDFSNGFPDSVGRAEHLRHAVRHHFEALPAARELQAAQVAELRHEPGGLFAMSGHDEVSLSRPISRSRRSRTCRSSRFRTAAARRES